MREHAVEEPSDVVPASGGARVLLFAERLAPAAADSEAASGHQDVNLHALTPTLLADLAFQVRDDVQ
jgi:hypothetical protein